MITLKNELLKVEISERGAEIKSVIYNSKEYVWGANPEIWGSSCPLLFPICGGLKEDKFTHSGREYTLEKHGFIRKKTFEFESFSDNSAVFLFRPDDESRASFPFDYELRVIYTLTGKTIKIDYSIKNTGSSAMYFNIGSHEGYSTPEGINDYDIIFPQNETIETTLLAGNLLTDKTLPILKDSSVLPLDEKYFSVDALVFTEFKSRSLTLKNRNGGRALRVDFPDDRYLLLWHVPSAAFICIEPWNGIPDRVGSGYEISKKEGITELKENSEFNHTHSITIIE